MRNHHCGAGLLALALPFAVIAAETEDPPLVQAPIVVTPTRTPETERESLAAVTVITRRDIETTQARDVLDLLRLHPGIDVARSGGLGQQTSVFLRGTNSNHTLVLIDGVRAGSANTGSFTWENLPVSQIERIEIVRGPRSGYYGSDALGGVIQIFTREMDGATFKVETGSFGTHAAEAGVGLGGDEASLSFNAAWLNSDGFSAQNPGGFFFDPDDDGYENTSLTLGVDVTTGARSDLRAKLFWSEGEVEFDQGVSDTLNTTFSAQWSLRNEGDSRHRLGLGLEKDEIETPVFGSLFETERLSLEYFHERPVFADGTFGAGINYVDEDGRQFDRFSNSTIYNRNRDFLGIFGTVNWRGAGHELQLSARYDDYSDFGSQPTANIAWGLSPTQRSRLIFSVGTAFRAPNFNELFSPGFGGLFAGNPDLNPEESVSLEADFRLQLSARQRIRANLFFTRVDDLIAFQGEDFQAINIDEANIEGLEASWELLLQPWTLVASATLQTTEDASTGAELLRRPHEKASLSADWSPRTDAQFGAEVLFSGERADIAGTTLDAYVLVNLRGRLSLTRDWTLEARLENLLNEDYELVGGFNTPERSAYVGLRWRPGPRQ